MEKARLDKIIAGDMYGLMIVPTPQKQCSQLICFDE